MTLQKFLFGIIILALPVTGSWAEDPNAELFSKKNFVTSHFKQEGEPQVLLEGPAPSGPQNIAAPSPAAKFYEFSEQVQSVKGHALQYRPTQEKPSLSAYIASQPAEEFFSTLEQLVALKRQHWVKLGPIYAVGSPKILVHPRMAKVMAGMPEGAVEIRAVPQLPEGKGYTYSPTYEVIFEREIKVYEGAFEVSKMFDAEGRFQEPVVDAGQVPR